MSLLVCCSVTGAPGVTTTALGLALAWPGDVLLCDADRDPGQVVESGYLRGIDPGGRGLMALATAHRERRSLPDELVSQVLTLQQHPVWTRQFLPGFAHPGASRVFDPVWPDLLAEFERLSASGTDVIVDAGRVGRDGLPPALTGAADLVLVVVRSSLRSLAAVRLHLPGVTDQVASAGSGEVALAVVGPGRPYKEAEISGQFRVPVAMTVAFDPRSAGVLSDGDPEPRRFAESALMRSLREASTQVSGRLRRVDSVISGGSAGEWAALHPGAT